MQKTSYFHEFFENIKRFSIVFNTIDGVSFIFRDKKNHVFEKNKCHLSWWCKENHILVRFVWKDHLFKTFEENIIFACIFWERSSSIFRLKNNIILPEKWNIIFPDDTRKIIFQCVFLERPSFQRTWKKKTWSFVQWSEPKGLNTLVWNGFIV